MEENCTVYRTADFVGKRWTILILLELYRGGKGKKRYSEIKSSLQDITPKILSTRLKELQDEGLISKKVDASLFPISCEYRLTECGKDFIKVICELKRWALHWKRGNRLCEGADCKRCPAMTLR